MKRIDLGCKGCKKEGFTGIDIVPGTGVDIVHDLNKEATSSAQDDIVVFVHTDEGIVGVGETDVSPWVAKACIEAPGTQARIPSWEEVVSRAARYGHF